MERTILMKATALKWVNGNFASPAYFSHEYLTRLSPPCRSFEPFRSSSTQRGDQEFFRPMRLSADFYNSVHQILEKYSAIEDG